MTADNTEAAASLRAGARYLPLACLAILTACSPDSVGKSGSSGPPKGPGSSGSGFAGLNGTSNNAGNDNPIDNGMLGGVSGRSGLPGTTGGVAGGTAAVGSTTCARGMRNTSPVTPTVWLVVDGSSSMNEDFDATRSRWEALRSTLIDPGGVVDSLQAVVRFGMVIYAGGSDDPTSCVELITVQPALNNLANLTANYGTSPLGMRTPTDKALDHVVTSLPVLNQGVLDAKTGPIYVVLATDGQPNDCEGGGGGRGNNSAAAEMRVLDVTTRGTQMGMQMFVVSLAGNDMQLQSHLNQVANATASKTPPYVPSTQADLVAAFRQIVGSASCQVGLDGMVKQGSECGGKVSLNGVDLACNQANGWKLSDPRTVQLTGSACDTFLGNDSQVLATFACDVFTPD
jgi:hypothetical protein